MIPWWIILIASIIGIIVGVLLMCCVSLKTNR